MDENEMTLIHRNVEACRAGTFAPLICRVPSGWAVLCDMQYLSGYSILLADPLAASLNDLTAEARARFLLDMSLVGDAIMEVTGAFRMNYAVMGNSDPYLHAHIVPRFASEPDVYRQNHPWAYPPFGADSREARRAQGLLLRALAAALKRRL